MFESILIRGGKLPNHQFDPGFIAEAMLFYKHVRLVCHYGTLKELLRNIPPFILLWALEQGRLEIFYAHEQPAVFTHKGGTSLETFGFARFGKAETTYLEDVETCFFESAYRTPQARFAAKRFAKLVQPMSFEGFDGEVVVSDLEDARFMHDIACDILAILAPEYKVPQDLRVDVARNAEGITVETNIDFEAANRSYRFRVPKEHSTLNKAYLMSFLQEAHVDIYFAARLTSEIAASQVSSVILERRFKNVLYQRAHNSEEIGIFSDFVLDNTYAIREAINTGKCNWSDYLKLLEKAQKFRSWLDKQPPDIKLVKEYLKETMTPRWVDKLSFKSLRWAIFNATSFFADHAVPGSGLLPSAIDTFLLEKIAAGWRPNHFIESQLKPSIKGKKT
ncbi:MAG: hypothetical protein V4568_01960 [Pseudomonadota bacterium]